MLVVCTENTANESVKYLDNVNRDITHQPTDYLGIAAKLFPLIVCMAFYVIRLQKAAIDRSYKARWGHHNSMSPCGRRYALPVMQCSSLVLATNVWLTVSTGLKD